MFEIYKNKKVLVTGHTGFKGSWLVLWLKLLGARVLGYALESETNPSLFEVLPVSSGMKCVIADIRDRKTLEETFQEFKPEFVFHLAAQPIVRRSYKDPVLTYETNVCGTLYVLEAARKCESVKAFVNVTTDKCYENAEKGHGFKEDDPKGGHDMYSSSKACVEIMSDSYRKSFLAHHLKEKGNEKDKGCFSLATARAGNVIGGGDWAQDRLVPDCVRSIAAGNDIEIRNPNSVRPWQFVLEPLSGYLLLGEKLYRSGAKYAQGYNFGPCGDSVLKVSEIAAKVVQLFGKGHVKVCETDNEYVHEAKLLLLNIEKAEKELGWRPVYSANEAVEKTVEWYKKFYNNEKMYDFTMKQIEEYSTKLHEKYTEK